MQTIQWQDSDLLFQEAGESDQKHPSQNYGMTIEKKQNTELLQLKKFKDPFQDQHRHAYITLIEAFGTLLANGNIEQITENLLTEDFEIFIFSSTEKRPVKHANQPQGFIDLYKNIHIQERRVRETDVDVDKHTVFQICNYSISFDDGSSPCDEVGCEFFTIRDGRISKYRAAFGYPVYNSNQSEDPLALTRKDRMLARVKEINYALAGDQPEFEKVGLLLDEVTKYKLCSWDDFKCYNINKNDFAASFESIQENIRILYIVPYELSIDTQSRFAIGTYVYHLLERSTEQKYVWLSTSVYEFDQNVNLTGVNQQGELHPEGEVEIPFEAFSREYYKETIDRFYSSVETNLEMIYSDKVLYDCSFWSFYSEEIQNPGHFQGLKHLDKMMLNIDTFADIKIQYGRTIDVFVDYNNRSHDVVYAIMWCHGLKREDGMIKEDESINYLVFIRIAFENGKIAKVVEFFSEVPDPIPTSFDDGNL